MTLDKLEVGKDAVIESVGGKGALRRHFLDMGLTPGTEVTMMKKAPMGDPIELRLRSYELTLRLADAAQIEISGIHDTDTVRSRQAHLKAFHIRRLVKWEFIMCEKREMNCGKENR